MCIRDRLKSETMKTNSGDEVSVEVEFSNKVLARDVYKRQYQHFTTFPTISILLEVIKKIIIWCININVVLNY